MPPQFRKVCVVTGTRAEYGLLRWVLQELKDHPNVALQLIVTGSHLSPEYGETWREITADGFNIDARVEMLVSGTTQTSVAKSIGLGLIGFADALTQLEPQIVVLLGDRYEVLAAAQTALINSIPVAHIHGGELSQGAIDDSIRHAITKMSSLHFVAAEPYRQRVIQLGEQPDRVYCFGAPGLDHLNRTPMMTRSELEESLGMSLEPPFLLVTYHPVTSYGLERTVSSTKELIAALEMLEDTTIVFTQHNADAGGHQIGTIVEEFILRRGDRVRGFSSLGYQRYLSAAGIADAVVGNSSSGLIEVPALGTPTVNIGPRQDGRLRSPSVIDCADDRQAIAEGIRKALSREWRGSIEGSQAAYGSGNASRKIARVLAGVPLDGLTRKCFHDLV